MTVESTARFISDLNETYPNQRDLLNEGDDHLRLIKTVLKTTFPGMDQTVLMSSTKANQLDETFDYTEEDIVTVNTNIVLKEGLSFDAGGATLKNLGPATEAGDALSLDSMRTAVWPIGAIFMTIDARNPSEILGFGTWARFAEGRVIIGSGSGTDVNNNSKIFSNEEVGGEYSHQILDTELAHHIHGMTSAYAADAGWHNHSFSQLQITGPSPDTKHGGPIAQYGYTTYYTDGGGNHTHPIAGTTDGTGGNVRMNIVQPYIACNIWVRQADPEEPVTRR